MEPISATASVIALLTLAGQVIKKGYPMTVEVKNFPSELEALVQEITSLSKVLLALQPLLDKLDPTTMKRTSASVNLPKFPFQFAFQDSWD